MSGFGDFEVWSGIAFGRLCQLCEVPLPPDANGGKRYCAVCALEELQPAQISMERGNVGWTMQLKLEQDDSPTYWMVRVTQQQLDELLLRGRLRPGERMSMEQHLRAHGCDTIHLHLDARQAANLRRAAQADPRSAYEKLKLRS